MANYVSLDEAAKALGLSPNELVEMRSRGDIFGYRDGASWKFKTEEIERIQHEMAGDVLDEDAGGSSILVSERDGASAGKSGSTIGGDGKAASSDIDSDLKLHDDDGSDVALVHDPKSGSGVRLVNRSTSRPKAGDSSDDLRLVGDSKGSSISDLMLTDDASSGINLVAKHDSDVLGGSELQMSSGSAGGTGDVIRGDSDPNIGSSGSLDLDDGNLKLEDDDEDDLVLSSGSDLALGTDSGINLMSPSDSGLSLEDEPLDLAGTGISGLDLAGEGSDVQSGPGSASASGSLVDFQQDEEFQLSPSGGIEADDDSGSQVIELEDSTDFGDAAVALPDGGLGDADEFGNPLGMDGGDGFGMETGAATGAAAVMRGMPEVPYSMLQVGSLLGILLLFGLSGLMVTDIVRNMWSWSGSSNITSSFTQVVIDSIFAKK